MTGSGGIFNSLLGATTNSGLPGAVLDRAPNRTVGPLSIALIPAAIQHHLPIEANYHHVATCFYKTVSPVCRRRNSSLVVHEPSTRLHLVLHIKRLGSLIRSHVRNKNLRRVQSIRGTEILVKYAFAPAFANKLSKDTVIVVRAHERDRAGIRGISPAPNR
jgi:hypothetical protein